MPGQNVLVVDDDYEILEILRSGLELIGCQVTALTDGRSTEDYLTKNNPDLIVLDVMLPDIDGITLCQTIRRDEKTKDIPIIMLTALSDGTTYHDALQFGATEYMVKPFDIGELQSKVKKLLADFNKNKK